MLNPTIRRHLVMALAMFALSLAPRAFTQSIWTGASGGDWNTAANWSGATIPGVGITATIGVNTNATYNAAMSAASFGGLTDYAALNVNAGGFNLTGAASFLGANAKLFVNSGGTLSGTTLTLATNATGSIAAGGSSTLSGAMNLGNGGSTGTVGFYTNNGGNLTVGSLTVNPGNSSSVGNMLIKAGTSSLGTVTVNRAGSSFSSLGAEGLSISGGIVTMSALNASSSTLANSYLSVFVSGGVITNTGSFVIQVNNTGRGARFVQTGGFFYSSDANGARVNEAFGGADYYSVTGGTNVVQKFLLSAQATGSALLTNSASLYVGAGGIVSTLGTYNISLNSGGVLGAVADWSSPLTMQMPSGAFTLNTADLTGTARNISLSNVLSGAGTLIKTGGGTLSLNGTNTFTGRTMINQGTLALLGNGSLASTDINVATNATFDVSAVGSGYALAAGRALYGVGVVTGNVTIATSGRVYPGSNLVSGTLIFTNTLNLADNSTNFFDLSASPSGPNNDRIVIGGDLNVTGTNVLDITAGGTGGDIYPLFRYGGTFNAGLTNFRIVSLTTGFLTNDLSNKTISFVIGVAARAPANMTWVGNTLTNDWDVNLHTNWLNAGSLDTFLPNDTVNFNASGAANPVVNLVGSLGQAGVLVNATTDYQFTGTGAIAGGGGLTKTNVGTLTILSTNAYTGPTVIAGGVVSAPLLANGGAASSIGVGVIAPDSTSLVLVGGTLRYSGASVSIDRGATLNGAGGGLEVSNTAATLTLNGVITGNGALTKSGAGGLTLNAGNNYVGGTVVSGGTLTLPNASGAGSGPISLNGTTLAIGAVKPQNVVDIAGNSVISGGNAGGLTGTKNVTGSGNLLLAVTTGVFDLTGDMTAYSGTLTLSNAGSATSVRFNGSTGSALATWDFGTTAIDLMIRSGSTLNNFGALKGGTATTTLSGRGGSANNAATTHSIGANGQNTTFSGVIQNGSGGGSSTTAIIKTGTGLLTLAGANTHTGTTTVNQGELRITGSLASGSAVTVAGGTLSGTGTIGGSVSIQSGGTFAPGASIGTLTVNNTLTLAATNLLELDKGAGQTSDKVLGITTLTEGGILQVSNLGAGLVAGDSFSVFTATTYTGTFASITPAPGSGLVWDTEAIRTNGVLRVHNIPVANNDTASAQHGQTTTIPTAKLTANDTGEAGETLSITAVSANASLGGGLVTYTAPSSGSSDIITYTLSDGRGGTATGTINVTLTGNGGSYNQLTAVTIGGGDLQLTYLGIPSTNYALEVSHDLTPPVSWNALQTNPAAGNGYIIFTNTPSLAPTNDFYRTHYVP